MPGDQGGRTLTDDLRSALPLRVRRAVWENDNLSIGDDRGWGFNTMSTWRISHDGRLVFGSGSPNAAGLVRDLCGLTIVDVELQTERLPMDPVLVFDSGWSLEVFSDQHLDPWVWSLPHVVIVGGGG